MEEYRIVLSLINYTCSINRPLTIATYGINEKQPLRETDYQKYELQRKFLFPQGNAIGPNSFKLALLAGPADRTIPTRGA